MQCLTHVLRQLCLLVALVLPVTALADEVLVDASYCDGLSLMAKATIEAKQRKEPEAQWLKNLNTLKGYGVRNKDNVLYSILPQAVTQVNRLYKSKQTPLNTYITEYNRCMSEQYGEYYVTK